MPCSLYDENDDLYFGQKMLSLFPSNANTEYSTHSGCIVLFEGLHGRFLSLLESQYITECRTAAVSALATKYLAKESKDGLILAIIGAGRQARSHIEAMTVVRKISKIYIYNRTHSKAVELANLVSKEYNIPTEAKDSIRDAVKMADIICTVTSSQEPIIKVEWVKDGAHINAVGAYKSTSRELDSQIMLKAKVYGDYKDSIFKEGGDFLIPLKEGLYSEDHFLGDLKDIVTGNVTLRTNDTEITVFKNVGLAIEDLACAIHVYKKMKEETK